MIPPTLEIGPGISPIQFNKPVISNGAQHFTAQHFQSFDQKFGIAEISSHQASSQFGVSPSTMGT